MAENNLNATLDNLKYYQGYTLSTTMVYDRGEGEETETLEDKEIQLDLKKVEIKNIKETSLMSVDADGNETDTSLLTENQLMLLRFTYELQLMTTKLQDLPLTRLKK